MDNGKFFLCPILINDKKSIEGVQNSYVVGYEIMNTLGMNDKEILELAVKNSIEQHPGVIKAVKDFVDKEQELLPDSIVMPHIYVLTNEDVCYGAAAMIYQMELLENIAKLTSKDLALFLTDKNCVHCVPVTGAEQLME